eukprot:TRINITY_DN5578_c1_g2_i1.p1 TRINITY_DN5578_c1_g2~~TRINITY_DN5578_c1_g2_i1.p1  ORF type:complete len:492 (+),score=37.89 TRINITY_DN5578_c1_g2_i1:69-1544(+)
MDRRLSVRGCLLLMCWGVGARRMSSHGEEDVSPVAIVAPLMVNSLDIRVDGESKSWLPMCHSSRWEKAWGGKNVAKLTPRCLKRNFAMTWDDLSSSAKNQPGVHVRPSGGARGFKSMTRVFGVNIWKKVLAKLTDLGLQQDETIIGHPYDWRLSVDQWKHTSFPILKGDIEQLVSKQHEKRAVVLAMSMGCPYFHMFLQWTGKEWNAKHIESFVPLDGPFNGAVSALQTVLQGFAASYDFSSLKVSCPNCTSDENQPVKTIPRYIGCFGAFGLGALFKRVRKVVDRPILKVMRTFPSVYWVMPKPDSTQSPPDDPVVAMVASGRAYRASEIPQLLADVGAGEQAVQMAAYAQKFPTFSDPGVPVHCIFAKNVQTPTVLQLSAGLKFKGVTAGFKIKGVVMGDGNRTVHASSLRVCERWASTVRTYELPNVLHGGGSMLSESADIIQAIVAHRKDFWSTWKAPVDHWAADNKLNKPLAGKDILVDKRRGPQA